MKLIRSKGVGIFFITQSPSDVPDEVLGQLGNKIQHALHAYTPSDQKAVRAAAQSFRVNPDFDTRTVLTELGIGEALVSFLQEDGSPSVVQRCRILPPESKMGPIGEEERKAEIVNNPLYAKYGTMVDRDSAYEFFQRKAKQDQQAALDQQSQAERMKEAERAAKAAEKEAERRAKAEEKERAAAERSRKRAVGSVAKTAAGTIGRELGNEIGKTVGGSFGKRLGGNLGASIGRGILGTLFGK